MYDEFLAVVTHFCNEEGGIKNLRMIVFCFLSFLSTCGFNLSKPQLPVRGDVCPALHSITNHPACVGAEHSRTNALRIQSIHHFPKVNVVMPQWVCITLKVMQMAEHLYSLLHGAVVVINISERRSQVQFWSEGLMLAPVQILHYVLTV